MPPGKSPDNQDTDPTMKLSKLPGDLADLPEPPNASADDQASSGSPSRARSAFVPEELDQTNPDEGI